jgi:hypothetical protein
MWRRPRGGATDRRAALRLLARSGLSVAGVGAAESILGGCAHLPFINGRMPGTNNCPGLRWIDRDRNLVRDYCTLETVLFDRDFPKENFTLFEMLSGKRTVCIFDFVSRGAAEKYRPSLKSLWFTRGDKVEDWRAVDHLSHLHGSRSQVVEDQAIVVDGLVGRIMALLHRKRIYDKTLVALSADHGLRDTHHSMDIRRPLARAGFRVLRDLGGTHEFSALAAFNAARAVSGNGFALLYVAKRKRHRWASWIGWEDRPSFQELLDFPVDSHGKVNLVEAVLAEPAVKLAMALESAHPHRRSYRVLARSGDGRIERDEFSRHLRYSLLGGADPLGYALDARAGTLMDGAFHDKDLWFAQTRETDYPDALFQISQLFDADGCGDLAVSSTPGRDFMDQQHRASHGGLEKDELLVPFVVAGPGIREGETVPMARTVDTFPLFLEFLGIPNVDGEVPHVFKE